MDGRISTSLPFSESFYIFASPLCPEQMNFGYFPRVYALQNSVLFKSVNVTVIWIKVINWWKMEIE